MRGFVSGRCDLTDGQLCVVELLDPFRESDGRAKVTLNQRSLLVWQVRNFFFVTYVKDRNLRVSPHSPTRWHCSLRDGQTVWQTEVGDRAWNVQQEMMNLSVIYEQEQPDMIEGMRNSLMAYRIWWNRVCQPHHGVRTMAVRFCDPLVPCITLFEPGSCWCSTNVMTLHVLMKHQCQRSGLEGPSLIWRSKDFPFFYHPVASQGSHYFNLASNFPDERSKKGPKEMSLIHLLMYLLAEQLWNRSVGHKPLIKSYMSNRVSPTRFAEWFEGMNEAIVRRD